MLHSNKSIHQKTLADWLGIIGGITCAVHCLVFPILVIYLSWLSNLHVMLEYTFIGIALLAVFFAGKTMTKPLRKWLWLSFLLFSIATLLHEISPMLKYLSFVGSAGLIICHSQNLFQRKKAPVLAKASS